MLHVIDDNIDRLVKTDFGGVQTEIVIVDIVPILTRVIFVIRGACAVKRNDSVIGFFGRNAVQVGHVFNTSFTVCVNKQTEYIRSVFENIVTATTDDDAVLLFGKITNNFCLIVEEIVVRNEFVTVGGDELVSVAAVIAFEKIGFCI